MNSWNFPPPWHRDPRIDDARHHGNIILGRLALQEGDLQQAKERLLAAATGVRSPCLCSFGPNMQLAKELLELGEIAVIIEYLQLCQIFWHSEGPQVLISTIQAGEHPYWGPNLYY